MSTKKPTDWSPEPFPEPRTFPNGWDGTALTNTNGRRESRESGTSHKDSDNVDGWMPEKFPKPRTFPKHWSVDD
jgi:hypothetical protein